VAADVLCKKWKPLIVWCLQQGDRRFSELEARLPQVTHKVLIEQLRELERDAVIARRVVPGRRKHVEYTLTELGEGLRPLIALMDQWGERHRARARELTAARGEGGAESGRTRPNSPGPQGGRRG
jgi:DNA-binding HxlR family transcriptional regulator